MKDKAVPASSPEVVNLPEPAESITAPGQPTFQLVGLEEAGDEVYISELSRSFTRKELENQDLLVLCSLHKWPHVKPIS